GARVTPLLDTRCQRSATAIAASNTSATLAAPSVTSGAGSGSAVPAGVHARAALATARQNAAGARPIAVQKSASTSIGTRIAQPDSWARAASSVRGRPRKTTPQALTKHASAIAPVIPSTIAAGTAAHAAGPF